MKKRMVLLAILYGYLWCIWKANRLFNKVCSSKVGLVDNNIILFLLCLVGLSTDGGFGTIIGWNGVCSLLTFCNFCLFVFFAQPCAF